MTKRRIIKKYTYMECQFREKWDDLVTADPHPIYHEVDFCQKGLYDHSGYTGYTHSNEGRPDGCYMCPFKLKFNRNQLHDYLRWCKEKKRLWKEERREYEKRKKKKL